MKKFLFIICAVILMSACGSKNRGYGYDVKTTIPETRVEYPQDSTTSGYYKPKEKESWWDKMNRQSESHRMWLYDSNGEPVNNYINAYKGEFDGKSWYVFLDTDGRMTVVENRDGKGK